MCALYILRIRKAFAAEKIELVARLVCAVSKRFCWTSTEITLADDLGLGGEVDCHAPIKGIERTFPIAAISIFFAITNYATLNLVDLFKATLLHDTGEDFAANSTGAVSDDWLLL